MLVFLERIAKQYLENKGYITIKESKLKGYFLARKLKRIITEYNITCFYDVGANIGQYGSFLREQVGFSGKIVSFEPDPKNYKLLLEKTNNDPLWEAYNFALGSEVGVMTLNVMKKSVFNSFLEPDHQETSSFEDRNVIESTVDVEIKKLEDIILRKVDDDSNSTGRIFLKIDTQGFDLEVFKGVTRAIKHIYGIQTELSFLPIYKNMPSIDEALQMFRKCGFEVSGLYPISESRFPHAVEFDCVYLPK